ncbi:MAG TPA: preprotein translocase subunit SecG [Bacteroidia bacterium]|nr:preprotein translocase subunit SecG [Bacteroidia bacterium]HNT80467.1 preprotein translocase subunit SecG [Bacteroidia bacterium]
MYTAITIFVLITAILLGLIVLVQNSKGGGLASGFSSSNQYMGVRKTTDFLEKLTWGLAIALMCLSMLGSFTLPKVGDGTVIQNSAIQEQIDNASLPGAGVPTTPPPAANPTPDQTPQQ